MCAIPHHIIQCYPLGSTQAPFLWSGLGPGGPLPRDEELSHLVTQCLYLYQHSAIRVLLLCCLVVEYCSCCCLLPQYCCCCAVGLLRHQLHFTTCLSWDQDWLNSLRAVHLASVPLRKDNEIITLITLLLKRSFPQRNPKSTYPLNLKSLIKKIIQLERGKCKDHDKIKPI